MTIKFIRKSLKSQLVSRITGKFKKLKTIETNLTILIILTQLVVFEFIFIIQKERTLTKLLVMASFYTNTTFQRTYAQYTIFLK